MHVCNLRECDGDGIAGVEDVVVVSAGHEGGTHAPAIVSSAADVLDMGVVRGIRGVGGVCELYMYLAWVQCGRKGR